jgi:molecular chaperone HscC
MAKGKVIGIDLGTTNSVVAVMESGEAVVVVNQEGARTTPSVVAVAKDGDRLVGQVAKRQAVTNPENTVFSVKRFMGRKFSEVEAESRRVPYKVGQNANGDAWVDVRGKQYSPPEISAMILGKLKKAAEDHLGETVTDAVITVPAYFNDKQRKATRQAGQLAGLKVERLINEPTAAALAYGLHQRDKETRFLVFDLGGGTFDVSILEIFQGIIEVRATSGDNRLGGEDFNEVLIDLARRKFDSELGAAMREDQGLYQRLREAAERTRRALTSSASANFSFVWKKKERSLEISADAFETECEKLLTRLRDPVLRSLRDSNIALDSLSEVILVGGATRMPLVRKAVTKMFGRFPAAAVNPDEAVARGAAVQAALKARHAELAEVVLTDVCPYTLGVASAEKQSSGRLLEGVFSPILERNCVVPASREEVFSTLADNQTVVTFPIYQGESRWVKDNVHLGSVTIPVPRARAGMVQITCRFSYDINGLLEVDLHVPESGAREQLVIVDREGVSPEQLEARRAELAKLKVHPRESDAIRAVLARAGRCYENAIGEERDYIGRLISQFEDVLAQQDTRACEHARVELNKLLDGLEGQGFL